MRSSIRHSHRTYSFSNPARRASTVFSSCIFRRTTARVRFDRRAVAWRLPPCVSTGTWASASKDSVSRSSASSSSVSPSVECSKGWSSTLPASSKPATASGAAPAAGAAAASPSPAAASPAAGSSADALLAVASGLGSGVGWLALRLKAPGFRRRSLYRSSISSARHFSAAFFTPSTSCACALGAGGMASTSSSNFTRLLLEACGDTVCEGTPEAVLGLDHALVTCPVEGLVIRRWAGMFRFTSEAFRTAPRNVRGVFAGIASAETPATRRLGSDAALRSIGRPMRAPPLRTREASFSEPLEGARMWPLRRLPSIASLASSSAVTCVGESALTPTRSPSLASSFGSQECLAAEKLPAPLEVEGLCRECCGLARPPSPRVLREPLPERPLKVVDALPLLSSSEGGPCAVEACVLPRLPASSAEYDPPEALLSTCQGGSSGTRSSL
mmetsp:Transcript_14743/g.44254  ORF Transcript_14743/g.44254 Transcript_14743/m.44254 type:complete len:444 (-) Transcript_14743:183-1514(-)